MRRSILAALALGAVYLAVAVAGPLAVGLWVDDSIYLCTAKSLAEGRGYRHIEIPGEPLQTKYPIGYPALLSLIFRIAPDYPENVDLLLAPTAFAAAGFVVASLGYWRRFLGATRFETLALGGLVVLAPSILSMVRFAMSDLLYALLAIASIHGIDRFAEARDRGRTGFRWLVAASLGITAAILTRSIGVTLAAGSIAFLLWRRRVGAAAGVAALVGVCLVPWLLRQAGAHEANAAFTSTLLLVSELDYGAWAPGGLGETFRVVTQNAVRAAFGLLYFELGLPVELANRGLAAWSGWTASLHALAYAAAGLILLGFLASARPRARALHFCAVPYFGLVLAYPGDPYRFFLPWTPFLIHWLFAGVRALWEQSARALTRSRAPGRRAALPALALGGLLAGLFLYEGSRILRSSDEVYYLRVAPMNWAELRTLEGRLPALTAPDDVIASAWFGALYLSTGRQGYYLWPLTDPYGLQYGPGRQWWNFFLLDDPDTLARFEREVDESLVDAYRAAGVDWYLDHARMEPLSRVVRTFVLGHLRWFEPVYETPGRTFRLHRVRLPPASP